MISQVIINNGFGESLNIRLPQTEPKHGLFITEIEGLGPVKADLKMSKYATRHGREFNSWNANGRDIIFHVRYLDTDGSSAEQARLTTYKFFPLGEQVTIYIRSENRYVKTTGYVESNEPEIFSETAGAVITVSCPSPWFTLVGSVNKTDTHEFSNMLKVFEFEFDDEPTPSLIFTAMEPKKAHTFYYDGEVSTGITLSIKSHDDGFYSFPTIYNNDTREKITIDTDKIEKIINPDYDPSAGIHEVGRGDEIRISSVTGNKYARYYDSEGNSPVNILYTLPLDVDWFIIHPGYNTFSYECAFGEFDIDIIISAPILLEGV